MQKGEGSNFLPRTRPLLCTQTFMGYLLGEGAVFGPQEANVKTASITTGNIYKAPATWQE